MRIEICKTITIITITFCSNHSKDNNNIECSSRLIRTLNTDNSSSTTMGFTAIDTEPGNKSCVALTHKQQLHRSPLKLDCRQEQHDELDIHDCVRHLLEMVNVVEALALLRQSLLTALHPQLPPRSSEGFKGDTDASSDVWGNESTTASRTVGTCKPCCWRRRISAALGEFIAHYFFTDGAICPSQLPKGGKYESLVCAAKYWLIIVIPELFGEKMNL